MNFSEEVKLNGFKIVKDFLPNVKEIRNDCYDLYTIDKNNNKILDTNGSHRVKGLFRNNKVLDIFSEELVKEVENIISCPIILGGLSLNIVLPESMGMGYHRDYPYYCIPDNFTDEHMQPLGVQIIIALDDFTELNGPTQFIPGSHKDKVLNESNVQTAIINAGDAIIMHSGTWHKVLPNKTNKERIGMLIDFHPYWVRQFNSTASITGGIDVNQLPNTIKSLLGQNFIKNITNDFAKTEYHIKK